MGFRVDSQVVVKRECLGALLALVGLFKVYRIDVPSGVFQEFEGQFA